MEIIKSVEYGQGMPSQYYNLTKLKMHWSCNLC